MADDWRLGVELRDPEQHRRSFLTSMRELGLEREARRRLGDRVAVSADGPRVFFYADSLERAREAEAVVRELLRERDLAVSELAITRWHPLEGRWEDAAVPLPASEPEAERERQRRAEDEQAEAGASGQAEWEVRVELPDHAAAVALADRLERDGATVVRRWRYLLVGAVSEEAAHALADRIRVGAGDRADVQVELSGDALQRSVPTNPFAVFGGLGG